MSAEAHCGTVCRVHFRERRALLPHWIEDGCSSVSDRNKDDIGSVEIDPCPVAYVHTIPIAGALYGRGEDLWDPQRKAGNPSLS
jgi:hypothetical protein